MIKQSVKTWNVYKFLQSNSLQLFIDTYVSPHMLANMYIKTNKTKKEWNKTKHGQVSLQCKCLQGSCNKNK